MRHEPDVRSYAVTHPAGTVVPPQPPGWHQVLLAASGAMSVEVPLGTWFVPPGAGVVVPDGVAHRIRARSQTRLRNLYLRAPAAVSPGRTRVVEMTDLLRSLVLEAVNRAPLWRDRDPHSAALVQLVDLEVASAGSVEPLLLPVPTDPTARVVAERILTAVGEAAGVEELCRRCGASRRTVERRFRAETGLGVAAWRRRARLAAALEALAQGQVPARVAVDVGYATPSAFGAMVKAELGHAPGAFKAAAALLRSRF